MLVADGSTMSRFRPVVHAHDWQAGFAPAPNLRRRDVGVRHGDDDPQHRLRMGHGALSRSWTPLKLGLDGDLTQDGFEFWGRVSTLKAGHGLGRPRDHRLAHLCRRAATRPSSAWAWTAWCGCTAAADFSGILNGIDTSDLGTRPPTRIAPLQDDPGARPARQAALRDEIGLPAFRRAAGGGRLAHDAPEGARPAAGRAARLHRPPAGRLALLGSGDLGAWRIAWSSAAEATPGVSRPHRLRRGALAPDDGRRRRGAGALALRALRADPALRPALRRAAAWWRARAGSPIPSSTPTRRRPAAGAATGIVQFFPGRRRHAGADP